MAKGMERLKATDFALLFVRLGLGMVFFAHGAQKLLGWFGGAGFAATMESFQTNMGLPAILVFLVIIAEFFGSLGLLFGLLTRLSALGVFSVMIGAIYFVHWRNGFFMNWTGKQTGEGYEYHLLVIAMALSIIAAGAGKLSLDCLFWKKAKQS